MQKIFIFFIILISTPTNLFSAAQDFKLDKKFPQKTVTLTIKQTKTTWEKAQEHKLRTAAGGFTTMITILSTAETIRVMSDKSQSGEDKVKVALGNIIFAGLSYYLLQPLFSEENDDTSEQNNNQH